MQERMIVEFASFCLDYQDESLWRRGERLRITPKAFAVLRHLVDHAGQLVTRDDLFERVWLDTHVSDDALTVCIRELRQILEDQARSPQYIETVRGRGYRFIAAVTVLDQNRLEPVAPLAGRLSKPSFMVARDRELDALHRQFEHMRQGQRQLVLISGEAGIGKTTLVDAFVAQALAVAQVCVAHGQCIDHYGVGEAYLPLLDAFGQLGQDATENGFLTLLRQYAPNWLLQMPAFIAASEYDEIERRSQGATRERMLRELTEAVEAFTMSSPLILVLEDLHWSDYATLDWLAFVARRRTPAQLLILGTYRPVEAIVREHPVNPIAHELQRQGICEELLLDYLPQIEIQTYLDQRFGQWSWPQAFVQLLHQRTSGNPFFLVTIVEDLIRQRVLIQDADGWNLQRQWESMAVEIPASIQRLIEGQLAALAPEDRELLETASVAGAEFAAAVLGTKEGDVVEQLDAQCSALARHGRFVQARQMVSWPDGTVSGGYRFIHALYQEALYHGIPVSRRVRLHQQIGARLERGYGAHAQDFAAELAEHFVRGRDPDLAVPYLRYAGETVLRRSAYEEAIVHLTLALELLPQLPDTMARAEHELAVQLALGSAWIVTKGYAVPEIEQAYNRAWELCQQVGAHAPNLPIWVGLRRFYCVRGDLRRGQEIAEQFLSIAQQSPDPIYLIEAHYALGNTLGWRGEITTANIHMTEALRLYYAQRHRVDATLHGLDTGVACHNWVALVTWLQGYPDRALALIEDTYRLAQDLASPFTLGVALFWIAMVHQFCGQVQAAQEKNKPVIDLSQEYGFDLVLASGLSMYGWALVKQNQWAEGVQQLRQGVAAERATGCLANLPYTLSLLAEAYWLGGEAEAGLVVIDDALLLLESFFGEHYYATEVYRLKGELTRLHIGREQEGEPHFQRAIAIAQRQQAKSLELRAAISLGRLWQQQGKRKEAQELLMPLYGWFTEGFDTADLEAANTLLGELAQ